ncbi:glycoside hydrolase family 3 C-terminal domain-containing protein [Brachyspira hyodysenteriae]|uniref:glycoside hydrolase family 3 C-terminal domain-containing protein n=1 Tax=Brachyspira hyodysenteriae TaxID=159 RepID=UPI00063DC6FE|nr:glycoside hydrolase family 3 C-terminal domain-containing protein [Brachyspira hyodysenteriae]KLI46475.1 glycosyl hydrolase family 3 [Brachyspira hyodysenteriae]TVL64950.1 glycosyl hydrolase [Brachyspira hyodysenteriae]
MNDNKYSQKIKELIKEMTLEEKVSLLSGKDFWSTKAIDRLKIDSVYLTDGPHGVRKQSTESDELSLQKSVSSTCFPTACCSACSFDPNIMYEMGEAISKEAKANKVAVVLGPGVNIKRSPLCGRNFEYFSEDPYLAGKMASGWINGLEDNGIQSSLKHFAANNQETLRLIIDSVVDERALREIYLYAFEIAVKEAKPSTVMCAYNSVNGAFASENKYLLTDILRDEWGFDGIVISDWGAVNDRVEALKAGLDLQMPSTNGEDDRKVYNAVKETIIDEKILDKAVERLLYFSLYSMDNIYDNFDYDKEEHHNIARKIAENSIVLLKNEDKILPAKKESKIAVIGEFAQKPRYQGNGSSLINAYKIDTAEEYFKENNIEFNYAKGYDSNSADIDNALIEEAVNISKDKDIVIIFAGLINSYESEGFDRKHLNLPENHNHLIEEISKVNKNVVVVLSIGAPVLMPWIDKVKGVINLYLAGEAAVSAAFNIIFGIVNPSGKLAESFPLSLKDNPSYKYFPGGNKAVEYRESIFVGYRYYDKAEKKVLFPFGFGLSYTTFEFSNLIVSDANTIAGLDNIHVVFDIKNTGDVFGCEVAQVYISAPENNVFKPKKELKSFIKVFLEPGETKTVILKLNKRSFSFYNADTKQYEIESGVYTIYIGNSSRNLLLSKNMEINSINYYQKRIDNYFNFKDINISDNEFQQLLGRKLKPINIKASKPYHLNNNLADLLDENIAKEFYNKLLSGLDDMFKDDKTDTKKMFESMMLETPLRSLHTMSGGIITREDVENLINTLNK